MDTRKLKEGRVQRYKNSFLTSKWKDCHAVLFSDSMLCLYNERGDSRPVESIFLKHVVPYICIGNMTDRMPARRPTLPDATTSISRLVAIGMDPKAVKVHWLLFPSEKDLEDWFNEIVTTLPKPANPQPNAAVGGQPPPYQAANTGPSNSYVPPAQYPPAPPPVGAYSSPAPYPQPQQQPVYNQAAGGNSPYYNQPPGGYGAPQQTVIIDRGGSGYGSGSGMSSGLGAGMGFGSGMLMGSLLGYGIGSFFTPHHYGGFGGYGGGGYYGGGYGGGFGGGYVQDNDTYTTNNYYINNDDHSSSNAITNPTPNEVHTPTANDTSTSYDDGAGYGDVYDEGGGGSWGDYDGGGDFGGGFDGGGGDW